MWYCRFSTFKAIKQFWKAKNEKVPLNKITTTTTTTKSLLPRLLAITKKCLTFVSPATYKGPCQTV